MIKKLLSEDDQEKRLFIKEAKILHGINMGVCASMLECLFFDFASFGNSVIKQLLDEVEHHILNYQNRGLCYLLRPKAEVDNTDTRF